MANWSRVPHSVKTAGMMTGKHMRKPTFKLPPGATDAHCHVFGPGDVFPYAPERRYTPADAPKEMLAALHTHLGLSRAVIVQASCHGADNRAMLDAIAAAPDRLRGVAIVDDTFDDRSLQHLHDGGVRGVRFNFVKHLGGAPDLAVMQRVLARIVPLGWHVVLHLDAPDIAELSPMIRGLNMTFVIDHMGRVPAANGVSQPAFKALLELAKLPNCWIKVSGAERIAAPPFTDAIPIAAALMEALPDRTLWGTDFPHPNLKVEVDESDLVDLVPRFAMTPAQQRALLVDNPARLYGFTGATT
jgi:2-pyrone-4,6-dicarboxylate lactonase